MFICDRMFFAWLTGKSTGKICFIFLSNFSRILACLELVQVVLYL